MEAFQYALRGIRPIQVVLWTTFFTLITSPLFTTGEYVPYQVGLILPCFLPFIVAIRGLEETGVPKLKTPLILPQTTESISFSVWSQSTLLLPCSFAGGFLFWWWFSAVESGWVYAYVAGVGVSGIAAGMFSLNHFCLKSSRGRITPEELIVRPMLMLLILAFGVQCLNFRLGPPSTLLPLLSALTLFSATSIFWSHRSHKQAFYLFLESVPFENLSGSKASHASSRSRRIEFNSWLSSLCGVESSDRILWEMILVGTSLFIARGILLLEGFDATEIYSGGVLSIPAGLACLAIQSTRFFRRGGYREIAIPPLSRWGWVGVDLAARLVLTLVTVGILLPISLFLDGWEYVAKVYPTIPAVIAVYYLFLSFEFLFRRHPAISFFLNIPLAVCISLWVLGDLDGLEFLQTPPAHASLTVLGFLGGVLVYGIGLQRTKERAER